MATLYIATTGNDTTGDGSSGNPYLTISKGISVASASDTIEVAVGTYNEKLTMRTGIALTLNASGAVILDGATGALTTPAITQNINQTIIFQPKPTTTGTWTIQNYSGSALVYQSGTGALQFSNTTFTSNSNSYGIQTASTTPLTINGCTFTGFTINAILTSSTSSHTISNNTFTDNATAIGIGGGGSTLVASGNTITNCSTSGITFVSSSSASSNISNNTYTNIAGWLHNGSKYGWTTWKALFANFDNVGSTATNYYDNKWYVNKSGNNSNSGWSLTNAKLTIQAGLTAMTTNLDTLYVGSGSYNENNLTPYSSNTITMYADGVVTIDANGLTANPIISLIRGITMAAAPTGGRWILKGSTGTGTTKALIYLNQTTVSNVFSDIEFVGNGASQYGIYGAATVASMTIQRCVVYNLNTAFFITNTNTSTIVVNNNTINNCTVGFAMSTGGTTANPVFFNNIITNCITSVSLVLTTASFLDKNVYYNTSGSYAWINSSTTYTSLATWKALGTATSTVDPNSIQTDPAYEDVANNIYYLTVVNPLGITQGAIPFGWVHGSNYQTVNGSDKWNIIVAAGHDNTGWYNPDGNVTENGTTHFFELTSGTSGVIWSPVYDLTTVQAIKRVDLGVNQTWGTNMADTTKTDTKPNYQTIEIRATGSSFNQDDATANWVEVKTEQPISVVSGRYVQARITLRSDDVAA
jgi:hypothetical protein